jgi:nucleoid-associated protein YgaU
MWSTTPIYQVDGPDGPAVVFGLLNDTVVPDPTDVLYTVPIGGLYRMDLISQQFYGTPDLWWAIARVNGILDPLLGPALGQVLRIPAKARLAQDGVLNA